MSIAAAAAITAAIDIAIVTHRNDEPPPEAIHELEGMARTMDALGTDPTAIGVRIGLIRLAWYSMQREALDEEEVDNAAEAYPYTTDAVLNLLRHAQRRFVVPTPQQREEIVRQLGEYERQIANDPLGGAGHRPPAGPRAMELQDLVKLAEYPDSGERVPAVDLAHAAVVAVLNLYRHGSAVPDRWWEVGQIIVDSARF